MADITMCLNFECSLKESCYRYNATPDSYQSIGEFAQDSDEKCEYYWEMNDED